jgi:hypothetical protein
MSFRASMTVVLRPPLIPQIILARQLLGAGWEISCGGKVRFGATGLDGHSVIRYLPSFESEHALMLLSDADASGKRFSINLYWPGDSGVDSAVNFGFNERDDSDKEAYSSEPYLQFRVVGHKIGSVDGRKYRMNRVWYEEKIIPSIKSVGFDIDRVVWYEGFD